MIAIALLEFRPGVGMALTAKVFERVGGGHASEPGRGFERRADREPFHQAAAEGVADACRIDDPVRRHRFHVDLTVSGDHRTTVFAAGDNQIVGLLQQVALAQPVFCRSSSSS